MLSAESGALLRARLAAGAAYTARELADDLRRDGGATRAAVDDQLHAWQAQGLLRQRLSGAHAYWCWRGGADDGAEAAMDAEAHTPWGSPRLRVLREARRCYGHLAGALGVALLRALRRDGLLTPGDALDTWRFTLAGAAWCERRGLRLAARERIAPGCLDGSERRDHLGGAAGRALLADLLRRGWLRAGDGPRALACTARGTREFLPWLRGVASLPN